jgi:hypothetical protein
VQKKTALSLFLFFSLLGAFPAAMHAQRERQMPPAEEPAYGSKFFNQLRNLFGRFLDSDLQRSFQQADPIQCSELVSDKGEWRPVAFFNEDRSLGEWCRNSLEEVKGDLTVFTFKGQCRSEQDAIRVTTEFPVTESIEAYNRRDIDLEKVDVNVNAPVNVAFDPRSLAYRFELPYLFLSGQRSSMKLYSLDAPTVNDRYASDVTSGWDCKAVKSSDVTYRFLICRTATLPRTLDRNERWSKAFGASAYFILSDGVETHTSVNLSFGTAGIPPEAPRETPAPASAPPARAAPVLIPAAPPAPPAAPPTRTAPVLVPAAPPTRTAETAKAPETAKGTEPAPTVNWQTPDIHSKLTDAARKPFRLRFSSQTWAGKIDFPQIIADQKIIRLPARPPEGADYCAWHPGASELADRLLANEPDATIRFAMGGFDKGVSSPASFVFDVKSDAGILLGKMQCYFPGAAFANTITFDRWVSVVGGHVVLETR